MSACCASAALNSFRLANPSGGASNWITRTSRSRPDDPPVVDDGFDLVNVFANWQINDHTRLDFGVDNVFNKAYTDPQSAWSTTAATEEGKGRTFKIALTGRIGG